ncbi:MAG TPA: ABC transporter permease [Baekduia sp.]|nr:ABC transporter permease [Baekduia sp.]
MSRARGPASWIARRLGYAVVILFAISLLVFIATQALPADPAQAILGRAEPARIEALRAELGLNEPLTSQYLNWIGGVVTGDLGTSLTTRDSVSSLIGGRLVQTLFLLGITSLVAVPLSYALGALAAFKRDSLGDRVGLGSSVILASLPEFVTGLLLVMFFATTVLHVLPAVTLDTSLSGWKSLILPVTVLTCVIVPYLYRLVRASTIEVLESDYVHVARLKGLSNRRIIFGHALPNAMVPAIQGTALMLAYLLGGVIVVEFLFTYPGLGTLLLDAIRNRDLPVIQGLTLIFAGGFLLFNLLADIITVLITPRLRTGI